MSTPDKKLISLESMHNGFIILVCMTLQQSHQVNKPGLVLHYDSSNVEWVSHSTVGKQCIKKGKYKNMAEWQKCAIMFTRANNHTVNEVTQFVCTLKQIVQSVCKEWHIPGILEVRCQNCGWKKILTEKYQKQFKHVIYENQLQT